MRSIHREEVIKMKGFISLVKEVTLKGVDTVKQQYAKLDSKAAQAAQRVHESRTPSKEEVAK
jgi:hypothetical protein